MLWTEPNGPRISKSNIISTILPKTVTVNPCSSHMSMKSTSFLLMFKNKLALSFALYYVAKSIFIRSRNVSTTDAITARGPF